MDTPLSHLSHVLKPVSTCPIRLYQFDFPFSTPLSQIFFWVIDCRCTFWKKNWTEMFSPVLSCWRGYKQQANFYEKTTDNSDQTLEHIGIFWFEFHSSILWHQHSKKTLVWKCYTRCLSLTHCHIPCRGSHHRPEKNTIHESLLEFLQVFAVLAFTGVTARSLWSHQCWPWRWVFSLSAYLSSHLVRPLDLPTLGMSRGNLLLDLDIYM